MPRAIIMTGGHCDERARAAKHRAPHCRRFAAASGDSRSARKARPGLAETACTADRPSLKHRRLVPFQPECSARRAWTCGEADLRRSGRTRLLPKISPRHGCCNCDAHDLRTAEPRRLQDVPGRFRSDRARRCSSIRCWNRWTFTSRSCGGAGCACATCSTPTSTRTTSRAARRCGTGPASTT